MRHAVGRQVEWAAPSIEVQSERWRTQGQHTMSNLTHRVLMGARTGFGQNRWSRTIYRAYRSITPTLPAPTDPLKFEDAIIPQLQILQDQLRTLGPYTMYTDGGWEYGGDGMDAPFHPATDSPSHKGGGSIIFLTTDLERIRRRIAQQEDSSNDTLDYVAIRNDHGEVVGRAQTRKSYWPYWELWQSLKGRTHWGYRTNVLDRTVSHWSITSTSIVTLGYEMRWANSHFS